MLLLAGTPAAAGLAGKETQQSPGRNGGRGRTAVKALAVKVKTMKVNMSLYPTPHF